MEHWRHWQRQHPQQGLDAAEWMSQKLQWGLDRNGLRVQRHLTILASVGATAPFVGLLGTVWGIYHALTQIGLSGQASIDQVAGPVGEALIMTALGLAVAIPAVLAYNALVRLGKNRMAHWREFAHHLQEHLLLHALHSGEGR
jgi:biopolymer transport protein ExbB